MSQEDDLRGLAKVMDFMRALSVLFVIVNVYWFCYPSMKEWNIDIGVVDRQRTTGLFSSILWTKLFALVFLALSCLGTKGVKEEKIRWTHIWAALAAGIVLFFFNWWLLDLPLPLSARTGFYLLTLSAGYGCLLAAGVWMSRLLRQNLMEDVFNNENESFMQETRLIENEYSVNLPTRFWYRKKMWHGWINVVNPFRASIVLGTPGSGKSFAVVNSYIKQQIEKGYATYIYDFKFPDLSTIAYNHLLRHLDGYKVRPKFYVINFDDPSRSHRCNPLNPKFMTDISDAYESSYNIMLICCNYLVFTHLQKRKVLHLPPCGRVPEQALRADFPHHVLLSRTGELPQPFPRRMARRGCRPAHGADCFGQDTALAHDFPGALLGDVRRRVLPRHQQPRRAEGALHRQQPRP